MLHYIYRQNKCGSCLTIGCRGIKDYWKLKGQNFCRIRVCVTCKATEVPAYLGHNWCERTDSRGCPTGTVKLQQSGLSSLGVLVTPETPSLASCSVCLSQCVCTHIPWASVPFTKCFHLCDRQPGRDVEEGVTPSLGVVCFCFTVYLIVKALGNRLHRLCHTIEVLLNWFSCGQDKRR